MSDQRGYTITELIIAIGMFATFALMIGGIYMLCHFIAKFW